MSSMDELCPIRYMMSPNDVEETRARTDYSNETRVWTDYMFWKLFVRAR